MFQCSWLPVTSSSTSWDISLRGRKWRPGEGAFDIASRIRTHNGRKLEWESTANMALTESRGPRKANRLLRCMTHSGQGGVLVSSVIIYRYYIVEYHMIQISYQKACILMCIEWPLNQNIPDASQPFEVYCVLPLSWEILLNSDAYFQSLQVLISWIT